MLSEAPEVTADPNSTSNDLSANVVSGAVVQAGVVYGGVHFVGSPSEQVVPRQLPTPPQPFVGRDGNLAVLDEALGTGSAPVLISAIRGAGGIGKTWLALHWAHRNRDRFPDGQLFVDLRGFSPDSAPVQPAAVIRGFLDALGVDPGRIPIDPQAQAALFRSLAADRRMLVVLDNAADTDQVVPLLPGGDHCLVVVTSRRTLNGLVTRHGGRHVALDVLPDEAAHALLVRRLGAARVAAETDAVRELIQLCQGFPLALGIVAGRAHGRPQVELAEHVTELRDLGLGALADDDPIASLPTVLSWSDQALATEQRTVFGLLGIAPGPDIGLPAAAGLTGLSTAAAGRMLRTLEDASLLERAAHGRFRMHDLIRRHAADVAANQLPPEVREAALHRAYDFYLHTAWAANRLLDPHRMPIDFDPPAPGSQPQPLSDGADALSWFDTEHACLLAAQHSAAADQRHRTVWQLAWALDTFHARRGHRHDRITVWQAALASAEQLPDPGAHALVHRYLGRAYAGLGQRHQALEHLEQALVMAEHLNDYVGQAHAHRMLAQAWERRGDDRRALHHAERALHLYRAEGHPVWEGKALNAVGWYMARLGHHLQAREHSLTALVLHRSHQHPGGEANALDTLGFITHHTGSHDEAVEFYGRSLALRRELGDTAAAASTLDALGRAHAVLGHRREARTAWREALELYQAQQRDGDAARVQWQLDELDD